MLKIFSREFLLNVTRSRNRIFLNTIWCYFKQSSCSALPRILLKQIRQFAQCWYICSVNSQAYRLRPCILMYTQMPVLITNILIQLFKRSVITHKYCFFLHCIFYIRLNTPCFRIACFRLHTHELFLSCLNNRKMSNKFYFNFIFHIYHDLLYIIVFTF